MLQMTCNHCGGLIQSPHLAEVELFLCPQCEEIIVVDGVVIAPQEPSSRFRSTLKDLLCSAKEKFRRNRSKSSELKSKFEIDKRLARLLERDDFRLNLSEDYFVQISFGKYKRSARLLNISSTGVAVEFFELGEFPEKEAETEFQLTLPGQTKPISLFARVIWIGKPNKDIESPTITIGMQFQDINQQTRSLLWDFIVEAETMAHKETTT